ncbi:MAG: DNA alkylation repair protein [Bacteroidia bacterium]
MNLLKAFLSAFEEKQNLVSASKMKDYMRGQFEYFGISSPVRRQIFKEVIVEYGMPETPIEVAKLLFSQPQREFHYVGQELLFKCKKQWKEHHIEDIEWFITTNSWWDTVDFLASSVVGEYFKKWPEGKTEIISNWNQSENMWLVRASIIFQLKYKTDVDKDLLESCIVPYTEDKEFFIRKAIGWSLRQYSRFNPEWVRDFVQRVQLQPLSEKEALRLMK